MPTLAGFIAWARSAMGISTTVLPDDSPWFSYAFDVACGLVNKALATVPPVYELAVYNLAGSNLLNYAPGAFFDAAREQWNLTSFVSGEVESTADDGTSVTMVVPDALRTLTVADLQYLKDPYGRQYLAFAQDYGTLWQ